MSDPWDDPEVQEWRRRVAEDMVPKMERSTFVISIAPPKGEVDIKFAVELGTAIMLGKPLVIVAETNDDIPPKLRQVADRIVIGTVGDSGFQAHFQQVVKEMVDDTP